jgi:hypothetical protein
MFVGGFLLGPLLLVGLYSFSSCWWVFTQPPLVGGFLIYFVSFSWCIKIATFVQHVHAPVGCRSAMAKENSPFTGANLPAIGSTEFLLLPDTDSSSGNSASSSSDRSVLLSVRVPSTSPKELLTVLLQNWGQLEQLVDANYRAGV